MSNPFPRYKLQILAHSALSTGVEDDVLEEADATGDKSGMVREVVCILCVNSSAEYLLVWSLKFANLTNDDDDDENNDKIEDIKIGLLDDFDDLIFFGFLATAFKKPNLSIDRRFKTVFWFRPTVPSLENKSYVMNLGRFGKIFRHEFGKIPGGQSA